LPIKLDLLLKKNAKFRKERDGIHRDFRPFRYSQPSPARRAEIEAHLQKLGMTSEEAKSFLDSTSQENGLVSQILQRRPDIRQVLLDPTTGKIRPAFQNFFAEFMDHAETSRAWLKSHSLLDPRLPGNDAMSRQLALDSVGHDGPSTPGSFWGSTYKAMTGRNYPVPKTGEGILYGPDQIGKPATAPANAIGQIMINGTPHYFTTIDDFFGTPDKPGAAGLWWLVNQKH
jgi:hypothetical protein